MKKKAVWLVLCSASAVILELLPFGAVLNFASDAENTQRQTFSYFSLTPFGYANFGPFLTAVLSVILLLLCIAVLIKRSDRWRNAVRAVSCIALLTSLLPLMFGISYFSFTGACISLLLAAVFAVSVLDRK